MQGFCLRLYPSQRRQLKKIERTHPSPRVRFRARLLLAAGKTTSLLEVARQFECSWHTVKAAINRYRQGGVKALADAARAGRPRKVPPKVRQALVEVLETTPRVVGLGGSSGRSSGCAATCGDSTTSTCRPRRPGERLAAVENEPSGAKGMSGRLIRCTRRKRGFGASSKGRPKERSQAAVV